MRRDSSRYGNFPKRQKSRERPWNRASPAFGKLWEHAGKCRVDLYEYMTARQYINFIQDVFEVGNERFERIEKYAKIFSIEKDLDQPIASFSHGMKQKVALIAAWVHQPKLVIMDEPFVGLDPTASHLLKQMMRELCEEGGAIFFSTHVLEVAEKLCDHIAIIKEGKLLKTGTMEEVKGDASLETVFLEMENESV